jgi:transcriptional regulator with XRE-family HTH domain
MSLKRLGMTLKRLREKRGFTQAALASRADLHRVYVAQIEAQTKVPSLAALERLAKALGVPVTKLLD